MINRKAIESLNEQERRDWLKRIDDLKQEWNIWNKDKPKATEEEKQNQWIELLKKYVLI